MALARNPKWLKGKEAIRKYIDVSMSQLDKWIEYGLPCTVIDGIYRAHVDNVDNWLRHISRSGPRQVEEGE